MTSNAEQRHELPAILIVDDEAPARRLLITYLSSRGFRTFEAENGLDALSMIAGGFVPDLILLDLMMPGIGGLQVLEELRRIYHPAELPIILLTALGDTGHVVSGLELGANDYISKPFQPAELGARIRGHVNTKRLLESSRADISRLQALDEIKDKFLQITAHDLKSPLGTIMMGLQILGDASSKLEKVMPEVGRIFQMMIHATRSMRSMIEDYLDLQVIKTGHLDLQVEPIVLNDPLRSIVENMRPYAENKGITLTTDLAPDLPPCPADPDRLSQVISNLLDNAIKFSPPGTQVTARTSVPPMNASGDPAAARTVRLEVQDNGPGISDEDMKLLFQEFTRLRNRPTGGEKSSGVGLAITRYLVEAHAGHVGVTSTPGEGSVFWVELPAAS